jgi:hypothetical protein
MNNPAVNQVLGVQGVQHWPGAQLGSTGVQGVQGVQSTPGWAPVELEAITAYGRDHPGITESEIGKQFPDLKWHLSSILMYVCSKGLLHSQTRFYPIQRQFVQRVQDE